MMGDVRTDIEIERATGDRARERQQAPQTPAAAPLYPEASKNVKGLIKMPNGTYITPEQKAKLDVLLMRRATPPNN